MSKIIDKPFNAAIKIFRTIFKGSPNLITSADLNRQIEALKYQMDSLDEKVGVLSDFMTSITYESGSISVTPIFTYLEVKGCSFNPSKAVLTTALTGSGKVYVCLTAEQEEVTYATDFSHDIAGAKFEDGTSMEAANQMVYKNEGLVITSNPAGVSNFVAILAMYSLNSNGTVEQTLNTITRYQSALLKQTVPVLRNFEENPEENKPVNGMAYDKAFSVLWKATSAISTRFLEFILPKTEKSAIFTMTLDGTDTIPVSINGSVETYLGIVKVQLLADFTSWTPTNKTRVNVSGMSPVGTFPTTTGRTRMQTGGYASDTDINKTVSLLWHINTDGTLAITLKADDPNNVKSLGTFLLFGVYF